MTYDYLIVGQGIAGTSLAFQLMKNHKSFLIIDTVFWNSPSRIANGIVNPVTGQKYVKTWMFDDLYSCSKDFYKEIERILKIAIYFETDILKLLPTPLEANEFDGKIGVKDYNDFLENAQINTDKKWKSKYIGKIKGGFWIDSKLFIEKSRLFFVDNGLFQEIDFDYNSISELEEGYNFSDNVFKKIVFCEGAKGLNNPFFPNLPFVLAKGEILTIAFENEMGKEIVQKNGILSPLNHGLYKFGSTNSWKDLSPDITESARLELVDKLAQMSNEPFLIKNHAAAVRPTTKDRKPFLGASLSHSNIYILNGLGTKGISLAPYFSRMLLDYMEEGKLLLKEVIWHRNNSKL